MGAAVGGGRLDLIYCGKAYPVGVPLVALYMQPPRVYKCTNGLRIGVAVLGLQSAPVVWVQHAPVDRIRRVDPLWAWLQSARSSWRIRFVGIPRLVYPHHLTFPT